MTILQALSQAANETWLSIPFSITDAAAWMPGKKLGLLLVKVMFVHLLLTSAFSPPLRPRETDASALSSSCGVAGDASQETVFCVSSLSSTGVHPPFFLGSASAMAQPSIHKTCSQRGLLKAFCRNEVRYICICCSLVAKLCPTFLWPHGQSPAMLLCLWNFPGKNTRMGCHFLLQGIFLTQGSNLHSLHWRVDSLPLSHRGSPCVYIYSYIKVRILSPPEVT